MTTRPSPRRPPRRSGRSRLRREIDAWFATIVRYSGLAAMGYAIFIDHLEHIALLTAASGMILFKSVWGGDTSHED